MKWSEINHLYKGFMCTVMFTTPKSPETPIVHYGRIICNAPNAVKYLEHKSGNQFCRPPDYAEVVVHEAKEKGSW